MFSLFEKLCVKYYSICIGIILFKAMKMNFIQINVYAILHIICKLIIKKKKYKKYNICYQIIIRNFIKTALLI